MLCRNPFVRDPSGRIFTQVRLSGLSRELQAELALSGVPFPCGQCLPCRINRRRVWTTRLILESYDHDVSSFVTLTYNNDSLPERGTLVKAHLQGFMKRLRDRVLPLRLRYFAAGEYGSRTYRPHYHCLIFGLDPSCTDLITDVWPFGLVHVGTVTSDSISYVAGYVVKKHVTKGDLHGRIPEFTLQSRRPGIGYNAVHKLAEVFSSVNNYKSSSEATELPPLRIDGKLQPLGRYLTDKISLEMELPHDYSQIVDRLSAIHFEVSGSRDKSDIQTVTDYLIDESKQRNKQIEWRYRNYKSQQRDTL